jgi:hypothetical protein
MKTVFSILQLFCIAGYAFQAEASEKIFITAENSRMKQTLCFDRHTLFLSSVFDASRKMELLDTSAHVPYFEFYINRQLVSSALPVWNLEKHSEQSLSNGGKEILIILAGKDRWKGLTVEIRRQYFPESTLIREQLKLQSKGKSAFHLNKKEGKLHFRFPQYALKSAPSPLNMHEIRMATYAGDIIPPVNGEDTYRSSRKYRNLSGCHMFHPDTVSCSLADGDRLSVKGPFCLIETGSHCIMSTYEHASQDGVRGFASGSAQEPANAQLTDASQGVAGDWSKYITDDDFRFIAITCSRKNHSLLVFPEMLRGGYLDNEKIPSDGYYETVWSSFSFMDSQAQARQQIYTYLLEQITAHKPARISRFYYNTWGLQRDSPSENKDLREIFTEARMMEEIDCAAALNVDLFILDDGWQEKHGIWTPNKTRLPNGLKPLIDRMKMYNIIPGAWLSLAGIDSTTARYREHPEWVIKDAGGKPLSAQWQHPVFDCVGDFSRLILEDHKKLIDQGIRYFKWDAVNTFNSALAGLDHGDASYPKKEIIDRYNYLLPFYITRIMRRLREYNPDVVVEIDLTEPERCLAGLMPLQEGKFFWMNNGASGYGDYSTFRTKSMRTVINTFAPLFPPEIFTYAVYPHNIVPYCAQRYNVNTALVAGHGFWGNLKQAGNASLTKAGYLLSKARRVSPYIAGKPLTVQGKVGSSPEIYRRIDCASGFGQVIAFSGSPGYFPQRIPLKGEHLLGVLNHAFEISGDTLHLNFQFEFPDDTREAFLLGNRGSGICILSSSGWLDDIQLSDSALLLKAGGKSILKIRIPEKYRPADVEKHASGREEYCFALAAGETLKIQWKSEE